MATSGPPITGDHSKGELAVDSTGVLWVCKTTGVPGTWGSAGSGSGLPWVYVPAGTQVIVPINRQHLIKGSQAIDGEFIINGEAVEF